MKLFSPKRREACVVLKKSSVVLLLLALAVSVFWISVAGAATAAHPVAPPVAPPVTTTLQDNDVYFLNSTGVTNVAFYYQTSNHSITSGQPWGGFQVIQSDSKGVGLNVRAGRKSSSTPFNWMGGWSMVNNGIYGESMDGNANFAFNGTLHVDGNNYPVYVAQYAYHDATAVQFFNCWVLSGPGFTFYKKFGYQSTITPDQKYSITIAGRNTFMIAKY